MNNNSKRFVNRPIEWFDLIQRFEAKPCSDHIYSAQGAIERLREEGKYFWSEEQRQLDKWREYCNKLRIFVVMELSHRRYVQNQDVKTALREFIGEFEHSTHGMYEMLYGVSQDVSTDPQIRQMLSLFEFVYRACTYAILSFWLDEKHQQKSTTMILQIEPDKLPRIEIGETVVHREMLEPNKKKHRRAMEKL